VVELCHVGIGILVVLVPSRTGAHREQLADGDSVVDGATEVWDVMAYGVLEALDVAILDRRADQRRRERLRNGEAGPAAVLIEVRSVALDADLAVVQDDEACRALIGHIGIETGNLERFTGRQRERRRRR